VKGKIMKHVLRTPVCVALLCGTLFTPVFAQQAAELRQPASANGSAPSAGITLPRDYVIGADDVLSVVFWRDKDMSADVVVRPDGKISLPLLKEIDAAGYTPDELRAILDKAAAKFVQEPNATVVVKEIHSRKVFITGMVTKGGSFPLSSDMTVLQLIAVAGGLQEYADAKNIVIVRKENGKERYFKFNYRDVMKQKNVQQNILLKPGDTVMVP
jgi:polysaccharide export outer membrane protein